MGDIVRQVAAMFRSISRSITLQMPIGECKYSFHLSCIYANKMTSKRWRLLADGESLSFFAGLMTFIYIKARALLLLWVMKYVAAM